jgi:hypothetical protein
MKKIKAQFTQWIRAIRTGFPYRLAKVMYFIPGRKITIKEMLPDASGFISNDGETIKYGPHWKRLWLRGKVR